MPLQDESPMPFGKHKNEKMANVPAKYLMWLYDTWTDPKKSGGYDNKDVKAYIEENMDVLKEQIKREAQ